MSLPEDYTYVGHFLFQCLKTIEVTEARELIGKEIQCKIIEDTVVGIADIDLVNWFYPVTDFEIMKSEDYNEEEIPDKS